MRRNLAELVIVLAFVVIAPQLPQFFLAKDISSDEFAKSGSGAVIAGIVLGAYRTWLSKSPSSEE